MANAHKRHVSVQILEGANKEVRNLEAFLVVEIIFKNVEANILR
jgi:hypothetical protein